MPVNVQALKTRATNVLEGLSPEEQCDQFNYLGRHWWAWKTPNGGRVTQCTCTVCAGKEKIA